MENRTYNSTTLGHIFPVRRPDKLTRQFIFDSVLPLCRDYFWLKDAGTSAVDDNIIKEDSSLVEEPIEDEIKPKYSQVNPDEIGLLEPNSSLQLFPDDSNEVFLTLLF